MADEKLNTGPAENISPEAAEPITTPEQTGPAIPEPGDVVVSFDKINELMAEKRQKYTADYHFHTAAQEHPELTKNALTRYWQKQRLRRQYRKQAKEAAKQSAAAAGKTATATERLTARAVEFVKSHPAGAVIAVLCIGYETAMRWTKGKYQFFVCTHTDKAHIHNHIYFNATAFDRSRKFHNFIGSSFALRRLSDRVCIEHELSVIQNPRQHSKGRFLHYGQWIGKKPPSAKQRVRLAVLAALEKKPTDFADFLRLMEESSFAVKQGRGGVISFLAPGQEKPTRLRASTLGVGFDPEDIKAVIAGERPLPELPEEPTVPPRRVNLIIDIQERMAQGKGPAYERWAKVYNLKQMAAALQYLQEHHLTDYAALTARTETAVDTDCLDAIQKLLQTTILRTAGHTAA